MCKLKNAFMKWLILILSFTVNAQVVSEIPSAYIGTWSNTTNTDTIVIASDRITFTSLQGEVYVDFVDVQLSITPNYYSFSSNPVPHYICLNKLSRVKMLLDVQDLDGLSLRNDTYFKNVRTENKKL